VKLEMSAVKRTPAAQLEAVRRPKDVVVLFQREDINMELGYGKSLIWLLFDMTGPALPPYLLEVVMKTGDRYYIHSPNVRDEERESMVLNIYDFRAIDEVAEDLIKKMLDEDKWESGTKPENLHPLLTVARLRCDLEDIAFCVEWLSRWWKLESLFPELNEEKKRALGFRTPGGND